MCSTHPEYCYYLKTNEEGSGILEAKLFGKDAKSSRQGIAYSVWKWLSTILKDKTNAYEVVGGPDWPKKSWPKVKLGSYNPPCRPSCYLLLVWNLRASDTFEGKQRLGEEKCKHHPKRRKKLEKQITWPKSQNSELEIGSAHQKDGASHAICPKPRLIGFRIMCYNTTCNQNKCSSFLNSVELSLTVP